MFKTLKVDVAVKAWKFRENKVPHREFSGGQAQEDLINPL
jgi:hypothetical protein